ncbi:HD domain-containing phosphohydrolase [Candidatus Caldatribacterium saccharofermentans]|uniref:HD domain-containing phosphohydrolase n=1 Tax=Candidatus Caldatribacterium saccharofermentans TaxID=1454753 RepID=UPI003CFDF43D
MMRKGVLLGIGVAIWVLALLPSGAFSQDTPIRVLIDRDYPPFAYYDDEGRFVGASVEFWRMWEERTGIPVELLPTEWAKVHALIQERQADLVDTIFYTPERATYLDYIQPLFRVTSSVYFRKTLNIHSLSDLTPHVVGAKAKDALVNLALSLNPSLQLRLYPNYSDIVLAAQRREIDCFLMDDPPANFYLVKYGLLADFSRLPLPVENFLHLATWKGNTKVVQLVKAELSKFSEKELHDLLQSYLVTAREYPPWLFRGLLIAALSILGTISVLAALNRRLQRLVRQATAQLERALEGEERARRKLLEALEVTALLPLLEVGEREFLSRMLDLALGMVPKASMGAALLIDEKGRGEIVAVRGHRESLLGFTFEPEELIVKERVTVVKDILSPHRKFSSPEKYRELIEGTEPVAETLVVPLTWEGTFFGHLTLDLPRGTQDAFDGGDIALAEQLSRICVAFHALREYARKEESFFENLLVALARALEYYDSATLKHSEVSAEYALLIARRLGLEGRRAKSIRWASLVHDIGKIFIPQSILRKPGPLTPEEYELVKLHPLKGEEILKSVRGLEDVARIVRHHHERFDGLGYPDGLAKEAIPLEARIVAVVDAFEAMTSNRPYRRAMSIAEAIAELKRCAGTQFDPEVVKAAVAVIGELILSSS